MKVLDAGHMYEVASYDETTCSNAQNQIRFMKREGEGYPGNEGTYPGTNLQEVLRVLIDRVKYLDNQIASQYNSIILSNLRDALWALEIRAAKRHHLVIPPELVKVDLIETLPACIQCGHIYCRCGKEKR